ncbi:shikimate dehydrogenase family protein [Nesterenkonia jeotgali]|uniref:Shikimate dehydrogenase n=1 Tax=Nesterenkonia jeotgali TaxID=317018 RepID=A0A839FGS0_9MICC|nr:shikimate dehydrogenase [Nesterenkonia jeotgali]MBA8920900.1 shikimate dehydrogenase [Nesterenkonia jeotgali]
MTLQAAVLGHPIAHSLSPVLHAAAYEHLGLDAEYRRIDVPEESLQDFLRGAGATGDWMGWSVTMPLKAAMVSVVDRPSARVRALGVLNTVIHRPAANGEASPKSTGLLLGDNTDVDGIVAALGEAGLHQRPSSAGTFGIIGAGATATAALAAAAELGFTQVRSYARSRSRALELAPVAAALGLQFSVSELAALPGDLVPAAQPGEPAEAAGLDPMGHDVADPDVANLDVADPDVVDPDDVSLQAVVSTLPPRAADELAATLPRLLHPVPLLDVAYDPWPSALAQAWGAAGGQVVSGLVMLLHQAVRQVELFSSGTSTPAEALSAGSHAEMVAKMRRSIGL